MPPNGAEDDRRPWPVRIDTGGPSTLLKCPFCPRIAATYRRAPATVRSPAELVTVATAAHRAGVHRLLVSAAVTSVLADYALAVRAELPALRVSVECRPGDAPEFSALATAGVTDVDIHIGSLDDAVRARGSGAGSALPLAGYERAWDEAVRVFGRYRVSTCLAVGAGENPDELVAGAARLIARGVHPDVVAYEAGADALVGWIGQAVADMLRTVGAAAAPQPTAPGTGGGCDEDDPVRSRGRTVRT